MEKENKGCGKRVLSMLEKGKYKDYYCGNECNGKLISCMKCDKEKKREND